MKTADELQLQSLSVDSPFSSSFSLVPLKGLIATRLGSAPTD